MMTKPILATTIALGAMFALPAYAELSEAELAKIAQNPVGAMISVPFQNNTYFNVGPESGTQNVLNIQPVIPFTINNEWNLITRTIMPLVWQSGLTADQGTIFGLGDIQLSAMVSPSEPGPGGLIWGVGTIAQLPTHTSDDLGNGNWGLGPQAIVLKLQRGSPWVYGLLMNNVWSMTGSHEGGSYSNLLMQPFVNYNFPGFYINSVPIITAKWKADSDQRWTVPLGLGIGKVYKLGGKLPLNVQLGGYYNVVHPDDGANWQLRLQAQFMFPK